MEAEECEICNSCVDIDQKGIECEICKHWFRANCVDIEDNEYEVLTNHKKGSIHWYCEKCNVKSVTFKKNAKIRDGTREDEE